MDKDLRTVLVVDDEADNLDFVRRALRRRNEVVATSSGGEALAALSQRQFSVIVADHRMPTMTGVELLARAKEIAPETVRIILTGYSDLDATVDAVNKAGVTYFLRKPITPRELESAVDSAVELYWLRVREHRLVRELEERNRELIDKERMLELSLDEQSKELLRLNRHLEELVVRDGLTGLYNHRYFQERAEQEVSRALRYDQPLSLVFFDIDYFKHYNDANGHPKGDEALVAIASLLSLGSRSCDVAARVRTSDVIARYGGEEFVVLLPATSKNGARIMAERIRKAVEAHVFAGEEQIPGGCLTASGGIAELPADATNRADLIERADEALYRAKALGRNRVCGFGVGG